MCSYFTTAECFVFSLLVATFSLDLMREPARPCLSVPGLRLNQNWIVNHLSWALFCPSCKLRNVIAVVRYTISCCGVVAFTDSQQGSFCFYLQIPKSGSFYLLGCTQKPVWLAGSSPEKFVRWRLLQGHNFFFFVSNLNTHKWHTAPSPRAKIYMVTVSVSSCCVRVWLFLTLLFFFFTFTHFNKAEHRSSGHGEDGQLGRWSRWKSTPGHVKSEIVLKLEEKNLGVCEGRRRRERGEGRSTEGWNEVLEKHVEPLTGYCKTAPWITEGYASGSSFLESKVQWYLCNNTVSFQHPLLISGLWQGL